MPTHWNEADHFADLLLVHRLYGSRECMGNQCQNWRQVVAGERYLMIP